MLLLPLAVFPCAKWGQDRLERGKMLALGLHSTSFQKTCQQIRSFANVTCLSRLIRNHVFCQDPWQAARQVRTFYLKATIHSLLTGTH